MPTEFDTKAHALHANRVVLVRVKQKLLNEKHYSPLSPTVMLMDMMIEESKLLEADFNREDKLWSEMESSND